MKVLHSGSLDVNAGGPALSMSLTLKGLENAGVKTAALCERISGHGKLIASDLNIRFTHKSVLSPFAYVNNINQCLEKEDNIDLYHIHGCWMHHCLAVSRFARKKRIPYVVAPRGMLYPQAISHHGFLKRTMMKLYQGEILSQAACVQATCMEEMTHYRNLDFRNPVAVLPNPIAVEGIIDREIPEKPVFRIGYLGRLHPRKRVERLIYAFNELKDTVRDCSLVIIGDGDESYRQFLEKEVHRLALTNVKFMGFLTGRDKDRAIDSLSLLVVPSDYENFGNIVTEALVRGVPVIASKGMPWQELEEYNCGWWVNNSQESINRAIKNALTIPAEKRHIMGLNGKQLIRGNYSVDVLGIKMKQLYHWILGISEKPDFVYTL